MKSKATILVLLWTLIFPSVIAFGQGKEFQVKKLKQYWRDEHEQPWNDLSYQMAVRLDPLYAKDLGVDEISVDNPPVKYTTGDWRFYSLQRDAQGTYAEVDYLVYKDSPDFISYEIELRKGNKAAPFLKGSREVKVNNDSAPRPISLKESNPIFLKDWLFMGGVMLIDLQVAIQRPAFPASLGRSERRTFHVVHESACSAGSGRGVDSLLPRTEAGNVSYYRRLGSFLDSACDRVDGFWERSVRGGTHERTNHHSWQS